MARDYKAEYAGQKRRGESGTGSDSGNAKRHRLRRAVEAKRGDLPATMDVDHKVPLDLGGGNTLKNARVVPQSINSSFARQSDGSPKPKGRGRRPRNPAA